MDHCVWWWTSWRGCLPALAVYRAELFPTGNRSRAAGLLTVAALLGGIAGLLGAGALLDTGWDYRSVMGLLMFGQVIAVILVVVGLLRPLSASSKRSAATNSSRLRQDTTSLGKFTYRCACILMVSSMIWVHRSHLLPVTAGDFPR